MEKINKKISTEKILKQIETLMEEVVGILGGRYQVSNFPAVFSHEDIKKIKNIVKPLLEVCYFGEKDESALRKNKRAARILKEMENLPKTMFAVFSDEAPTKNVNKKRK